MSDEAYFEAIRGGDGKRLRELIEREPKLLQATTGPDRATGREMRCTGLHVAICAEQTEAARALIEAGVDLEARTLEGRTALHDSIEFGQTRITELLLDDGAELDICSAAILGKLDRVRELLDGDPTLVDDRTTHLSPLGWASYGNQVETAGLLIERGAGMNDGELLCAASVGHAEVGRLLIEKGADPDVIDESAGGNALHAAASMKYTFDSTRFIQMLLDHGVDVNTPTRDGRTGLQLAESRHRAQEQALAADPEEERRNFAGVIELLRRHGATA